MSVILTSTPRKTMEVLGGESSSSEVLRPRDCKKLPKAWEAATDLCMCSQDSDT